MSVRAVRLDVVSDSFGARGSMGAKAVAWSTSTGPIGVGALRDAGARLCGDLLTRHSTLDQCWVWVYVVGMDPVEDPALAVAYGERGQSVRYESLGIGSALASMTRGRPALEA